MIILFESLARPDAVHFEGKALKALTTLSYSRNVDLQRSAALAFAEITERHIEEVETDVLDPLLFLLRDSSDIEVQRASSAALGNLAVNLSNKLKIVRLGGLEPLMKHMQSSNVEVQCNAVGCITNLATHEENKAAIARSGALIPLIRLAKTTKDIRVQRNATGALLNMTHSEDNRKELADAGAIPVLASLLHSTDDDVVYYCTTAISNLAVDSYNRKRLSSETRGLIHDLVDLMESSSVKAQCQAALALRNLASEEFYQIEIAKSQQGLARLLRILNGAAANSVTVNPPGHHFSADLSNRPHPQLILAAVACVRNISIHPRNESPIIEAGFLPPLVDLLSSGNDEIQCHAISTVRNLAAGSGIAGAEDVAVPDSSDDNKDKIMQSGAVQKIQRLIDECVGNVKDTGIWNLSWPVLSEMTACLAVLALSPRLKPTLLESNIVKSLIPLTHVSTPSEVQGNAAAALGNLATKTTSVKPFLQEWDSICLYLERFLEPIPSSTTHYHEVDEAAGTFQHIAMWTILQFCEKSDETIIEKIKSRPQLVRLIRGITSNADEEVQILTKRVLDILGEIKSA